MKKKIIAFMIALASLVTVTAFADNINAERDGNVITFEQTGETIALVSCFDEEGNLCYGNMYKSEDGIFTAELPEDFVGMKTKIYFVNSNEIKEANITTIEPTPEPTLEPTAEPTVEPSATPIEDTSVSTNGYPSIYEKTADAIYAPVVVKSVETTTKDGDDAYAVTILGYGEEKTVLIEADLTFDTSSEQYAYMKSKNAGDLQTGDIIVLTANVAGTRIKTMNFIYRPVDGELAFAADAYGADFEKLISENGTTVASNWKVMKYGEKASSDRYQYALGIIGKVSSGTITLLNGTGDTRKAVEIDTSKDTIVYTCTFLRDTEVEVSDIGSVTSSIPKTLYDKNDVFEYEDGEAYNYALVRVVDGIATDIVVYENED